MNGVICMNSNKLKNELDIRRFHPVANCVRHRRASQCSWQLYVVAV